jgi:hypothetical protein
MLSLVDHPIQPSDIESSSFVIHHIFEMMQCPGWTLLDALPIVSIGRNLAIASLGVPITPSIEGVLVLAVEAATLLFFRLAWSDLDEPSVDLGTQGGKRTVGCRFVGEVDKAIAGVPRAHGINRDVDSFCLVEAIGGKEVLDVVGTRLVR